MTGNDPSAANGGRTSTGAETGKAIVLFSDGTGNSSAKLFKTNVWRMYEAVDLGPPAEGCRPQISYYDDGVGTSSFKPFAVLGGAFGYGLKRNVLDIYRYACRNYRPGDEIYGFGFSRGAFTMRVAIALIAAEGLVESGNEQELRSRSVEAYRRFRRDFKPRKLQWPTTVCRNMRDGLIPRWNRMRSIEPYDQRRNRHPVIRFVGVWDTVSAYGGPIVEITRAIDNWVFPLSMPDYVLNPKVQCARHALALDDERDAFHPLLWDEVSEEDNRAKDLVGDGRLQQVWFTGMHSDVGGGYPDESLSYVSLLWMMEEAEKADLRTLDTIKDHFIALASSAGPIHDSRHGLAAYYRYQPRKIAAWVDPVDRRTYALRDPIVRHADGHPKGLLRDVHIHESVIARIANGTDRYAPITLPEKFDVVPPQREGETVPQPSSQDGPRTGRESAAPMVSLALRNRLAQPDIVRSRAIALEAVWDLVWRRRVAYFVTVGLTLFLVLMPGWADDVGPPPLLGDGRTWFGSLIRIASAFLPGFVSPWIDTYAENSVYFLLLAGAIALVMLYSARCELRLRDRARRVWREAVALDGPPCHTNEPSGLQQFRNHVGYQRTIQFFKWALLPNGIFLPIMLFAGLWFVAGSYTQARLPWLEKGVDLCTPVGGHPPELTTAQFDFWPAATCVPADVSVKKGQSYLVAFDVVDEWRDSQYATTPEGLPARKMNWGLGYLGAIFRRVVHARYLQPAIEIRPAPRRFQFDNVYIYPLQVRPEGRHGTSYVAEFTAEYDGELLMFANDGVSPVDLDYFYKDSGSSAARGNSGSACVTIRRTDRLTATLPPPASKICQAAAKRASAMAGE